MNFLDKQILHIKIPKNGTHSINKVLGDKDCWKRDYFFGHDPLYVLEENNLIGENVFVFCVSRNPFTRFYSQYQQLLRTQKNYNTKSIFDFTQDIISKKLHPVFCAPQVEWINAKKENILPLKCTFENLQENIFSHTKNSTKPINISKKINKIYKLENIIDFELDFKVKLNYYNYSEYSLEKYKNSFNKEIISFIVDYYDKDFYVFKYSKDFNESIDELNLMRKKLFYYN